MDPCSPTCKTASPLLLSAFHLHLYVREAWLWRGSVSFSFILPCLRLAEFLGYVNWSFTQNLRKKESQTLWEFDKYFWLHSVFMALLPTVLSHVFCMSSSKYNAWFHTSVLLLRFLLEMTILPACYQLTSAARSHWSPVQCLLACDAFPQKPWKWDRSFLPPSTLWFSSLWQHMKHAIVIRFLLFSHLAFVDNKNSLLFSLEPLDLAQCQGHHIYSTDVYRLIGWINEWTEFT